MPLIQVSHDAFSTRVSRPTKLNSQCPVHLSAKAEDMAGEKEARMEDGERGGGGVPPRLSSRRALLQKRVKMMASDSEATWVDGLLFIRSLEGEGPSHEQ